MWIPTIKHVSVAIYVCVYILQQCKTEQENKQHSNLGSGLRTSTDRSRGLSELFETLLLNPSVAEKSNVSFEQVLRGLLMVCPSYETPWMAVLSFVSNCNSLDRNSLCIAISSIETFLRCLETNSVMHIYNTCC